MKTDNCNIKNEDLWFYKWILFTYLLICAAIFYGVKLSLQMPENEIKIINAYEE